MTIPPVKKPPSEDELKNLQPVDTPADDEDVADDEEAVEDDDEDGMEALAQGQPRKVPTEEPQADGTTAEELARFREEWRADLDMRRKRAGSTQAGPSADTQPASTSEQAKLDTTVTSPPKRSAQPVSPTSAADSTPGTSRGPGFTAPLPRTVAKALEIYKQAVAHEQRSELDQALRLYRQAFRIHEDVARLYERLEFQSLHVMPVDAAAFAQAQRDQHKASVDMARLAHDMDKLHVSADDAGGVAVTLPAHHGVVTGTLASIMASWTVADLKFEPEDEKQPVHLQTLPDELLVDILEFLDTTTLERFASINRKARVLTLDSSLWRRFVVSIYQSPQIGEDEDVTDLVEKYKGDFRRVYIEHPRIRLDGVYIAVCHYIRNGLSENAWVNVSHLVTYHRYLRFYPNGEVLSLLANEEVSPQSVIPVLKPTLRMKGFFIGSWRLEGTTVYITDLMDPSGGAMRYSFQMVLELRSRPLGRWNKLDFRTYDSVSLTSGEATPLALKNDRPFWFSKVKSYA